MLVVALDDVFSYSSIADLKVPKIFVTSTDIAIVAKEVSFLFRAITSKPLRLLAVLKNLSISIRSVLSFDAVLRDFFVSALFVYGRPSFGPLIRMPLLLQN